jgi:hypothetical protein
MHEYALKCVWEKTTPLSGKNNTYPAAAALAALNGIVYCTIYIFPRLGTYGIRWYHSIWYHMYTIGWMHADCIRVPLMTSLRNGGQNARPSRSATSG